MRNPAFQRRMGLLALFAMLLLVCMPVASRLLANGDSDGAWSQMCTSSGLKLVKAGFNTADFGKVGFGKVDFGGAKLPQPGGDPPMADDCPYCPVMQVLAALALCIALVLFPRETGGRYERRRESPDLRWHPCGLGSRGPPLAL